MSSRFSEESAAGDAWQEKYEQLQNELALAQYEAQKWKEKYVVEKRRRQKTARDLLDLVVRTERHPSADSAGGNGAVATATGRSSSLLSADHTGNLLSPTLSSFDFDDDSSEEDDDEGDDQKAPGPPPPLVTSNRQESVAEDASALDGPATRPFNPSIALDLRDRQSLMYHLNATATRPNRSSTTGSALEAFGGSSHRMMDGKNVAENGYTPPPQNLMYRIMYAKPSSRDLWHSRAHPNKLQNVARSIMFSMHLKKEHIFERFFVAGMTLGEPERQQATQTAGLAGFWKPKVLYEFPHRVNGTPDESVADFCFPRGVPLVVCNSDQAAALHDAVVSKWFTEVEPLQKHISQASQTSGYTFRLTGAKGEVLYGFCVAVMKEVLMTGTSQGTSGTPKSPHSNWASNWLSSSKEGNKTSSKNMAPVCYCFTSKFPFYRFHFALLRMIVENEMEQQALRSTTGQGGEPIEDEQFEIILRPLLNLAVEFTLYHEENARMKDQSSQSETGNQRGLNSIASKMCVASPSDRRVVLSEDASVAGNSGSDSQLNVEKRTRPSQLRKSLSTDDISTYSFSTGWIVDKPMVKRIEANQPKEYERVRVGDVLEAVDNIATASMTFEETLEMLEKGNRPMRLRFRRAQTTATPAAGTPATSIRPKHHQGLSASSIDILYRARRMKINNPGNWSTARFPTYNMSYQFPKRQSDRWSVGVVLRFLKPEKVVEILASLLLEKQVVIMSDSPAKATAVCTALMLLLAPFQWQSTYIPLLPSGLLDFLHSPVPFLAGCHSLDDTSEWVDVCFYDIDKDLITLPAVTRHLGPTSIPNGVELCRLFRTARERFCALRTTGKPWYELSDEEDKIITLTLQESEIFLRDLGFDISSQDLAASISGGKSFYDRLQEEVAKEVRNSIYEDYLDEFTQTQLFCQYYESLLQPEVQEARH